MKKFLFVILVLFYGLPLHAQYGLMPVPHMQFLNNSAAPLSGGKLCTYAAGTTTIKTTYSTSSGTALPNPITLNSAGRPQTAGSVETGVYLDGTSYKFILYAAGTGNTCNGSPVGTQIWSQDNVIDTFPLTINPITVCLANQSCQVIKTTGTLTEASSGTHPVLAGLWVDPPTITNGAAATTDEATVHITGSPAGAGTNHYALNVVSGISNFGGSIRSVSLPPNSHAFGTGVDTRTIVNIGGINVAQPGQQAYGLLVASALTLDSAANDGYGVRIANVYNTPASGTVSAVSNLNVSGISLNTAGGAGVTTASAIHIPGSPISTGTATSNIYAIFQDSTAVSRYDGPVLIGNGSATSDVANYQLAVNGLIAAIDATAAASTVTITANSGSAGVISASSSAAGTLRPLHVATNNISRLTISTAGETVLSRTCTGISTALCLTPNAGTVLTVSGTTSTVAPSVSGLLTVPLMHIVGADLAENVVLMDSFAGPSEIRLRRANGSLGTPSALLSGEVAGQVTGAGYGVSYGGATARAAVQFFTTENWTGTAQGIAVAIKTTTAGSTTILTRAQFKDGLIIGSATGDDCGAGCINVSAGIRLNNTAYTNPDYAIEQWATGKIELFADRVGADRYRPYTLGQIRDFAKEKYYLPQLDFFGAHDEPSDIFERADVLLTLQEDAYRFLWEHADRIAELERKVKELSPR